jgi:error-prone DNA polymerase
MRGLAAEFGLIVPKGIDKLVELMALIGADESVPKQARQTARELFDQREAVGERIETLEAEIVAHARQDEAARRLATIPGVGPITASLIAATVADFGVFKRARDFAAWLGLVPRQHSSAGKTRLGKITKSGNREIRKSLVMGALSMTFRAPQWKSAAGAWTCHLLESRPVRLVSVALANKIARIAWALMTRGEVYHAKGRLVAAAEPAA